MALKTIITAKEFVDQGYTAYIASGECCAYYAGEWRPDPVIEVSLYGDGSARVTTKRDDEQGRLVRSVLSDKPVITVEWADNTEQSQP